MADAEATKPKKKKGKMLLLILGALVLAGGSAGGALFYAGSIGGSKAKAAPEKDLPKLVLKGEKKDEGESKEGASAGGSADGGPKYESSYYQLDKEFTSNLRDSAHLIQVGIAVSTNYDSRVIKAVQGNELAVRSAVLMQLSETDEDGVFTAQGKQDLQKRLVVAINQVLKEKEGFGGVGNVYFTNFIVQ